MFVAAPGVMAADADNLPAPADPVANATPSTTPVRPWFELGGVGYFGGNNYSSSGQAQATWFSPLSQDGSQLWFVQLDGRFFFDESAQEGNIAVGHRRVLDNYILGGFASYDFRNSINNNMHQQLTLGAELLATTFDVRGNLYLPLTGAKSAPQTADVVISGSNIAMIGGFEVPLWGFDAEAGARIFSSADSRQQVWAHAGGYYFDSWDEAIEEAIYGPQFRAEYRFNDAFGMDSSRFTLALGGRWDEARGTQFQAGARFRIALGAPPEAVSDVDALWARMSERVYRDPDIVLGQSAAEQVEDVLTDVVFEQVAYSSDLAVGDLGAAVGAAAENTLLIVNEDYDGAQTINTGANVTIAGQGGTFTVAGTNSGTQVELTLPGSRRALAAETSSLGLTALTIGGSGNSIGEGVHLVGLDVTATHSDISGVEELMGIYMEALSHPIFLEDMSVFVIATPASDVTRAFVHGLWTQENDSSAVVTVLDSQIGASLTGTLQNASEPAETHVYAVRSHDTYLGIENSTLLAYSDAAIASSTGTQSTIQLYGIRASGGGSITSVANSSVLVDFAGTMEPYTPTMGPSQAANAFLYGVYSTDQGTTINASTIGLIFDATLSDNVAADLYGIRHQGPATGAQTLTVTDTIFSIDGADSANWTSYDRVTASGLWLDKTTSTSTLTSGVLFSGNQFAGVFNDLMVLNTDYTFYDGSIGNTADNATYDAVCADSGVSWSGSFELGGVTYTAADCN